MCDTAYVLILAQIERRVIAEFGLYIAALQAGNKDLTMPTLPDAQDRFDAGLAAAPEKLNAQKQLLHELGVLA